MEELLLIIVIILINSSHSLSIQPPHGDIYDWQKKHHLIKTLGIIRVAAYEVGKTTLFKYNWKKVLYM